MTSRWRIKACRPGGLTLAEVMVALAVLLVVAVAMIGFFASGLWRQGQGKSSSVALMLAQRVVEDYSSRPGHALADEDGVFPSPHDAYRYEARLTPRGPQLHRLEVTVLGPGGVRETLATLLHRRPGKVVFQVRESGGDLWMMNADGTEREQLTDHPALDTEPDVSSDCSQVAFVSWREESTAQVHVLDLGTRRVRRLTSHPKGARTPKWSPTGDRLAFVAQDMLGERQVYVVGREGGMGVQVTPGEGPNFGPAWSPDGQRLAFVSKRDGDLEVYAGIVGGTARRLTESPGWDVNPAWSPLGDRIAFVSQRGGCADVYTMSPVGKDVRRLTQGPMASLEPSWSPDGRKLLFVSDRDGEAHQYGLYVMNADGTAVTRLAEDVTGTIRSPSWGQ